MSYRPRRVSKCKLCEAYVVWATTIRGKKMPIDEKPSDTGGWALQYVDDEPRTQRVWESYTGPRHTTHFETCPYADRVQRNRRAS